MNTKGDTMHISLYRETSGNGTLTEQSLDTELPKYISNIHFHALSGHIADNRSNVFS